MSVAQAAGLAITVAMGTALGVALILRNRRRRRDEQQRHAVYFVNVRYSHLAGAMSGVSGGATAP